ncbi:MAG: cation-translocating P-type ATPase [Sphingomonadaceae bacterium]
MARQTDPNYHALAVDHVLDALSTEPAGLSSDEAARRLAEHGANRLPEPPRRSTIVRFLLHFHNILIYVLLASAVITAALGHMADTGVILAVVIANAIIGFIQEGRAENAMAAIRGMLAPHTAVLRDGARQNIDAVDLIPGDIVLLEAGDRVPADLRLIKARGLKVEEAILTGESVPVDKGVSPVAEDASLGDRLSMLFSGTLLVAGTARGVVVATGADTEIGRISGMLADVEMLTTPLVRQMDAFARWLTLFILLVSAGLLIFGTLVRQLPFDEMFMIVVGLAVAAIPEGLPAVLTIALAVGVQAMARRNAIVRRLPAIETLGSVSVICTDKTGTLTRNEMAVTALVSADSRFAVSGEGYAPDGVVHLADRQVEPAGDQCRSVPGCAFSLHEEPLQSHRVVSTPFKRPAHRNMPLRVNDVPAAKLLVLLQPRCGIEGRHSSSSMPSRVGRGSVKPRSWRWPLNGFGSSVNTGMQGTSCSIWRSSASWSGSRPSCSWSGSSSSAGSSCSSSAL